MQAPIHVATADCKSLATSVADSGKPQLIKRLSLIKLICGKSFVVFHCSACCKTFCCKFFCTFCDFVIFSIEKLLALVRNAIGRGCCKHGIQNSRITEQRLIYQCNIDGNSPFPNLHEFGDLCVGLGTPLLIDLNSCTEIE